MKLAKLLQQIENRKQHLVKVLPDFNTATLYTIPETFKLNRERFMFEYYLLKLDAITPKNQSEKHAIERAQWGIKNMLRRMYEVHVDITFTEIPSATQLKENLVKTTTRFFVDAAGANDFELLAAAMEMGATVNGQYCRESAIGEATKSRHGEMVKHLIRIGANVDVVDGVVAKRTALDYAEKNADYEMKHILQQAGAVKQFHVITKQQPKQPVEKVALTVPIVDYQAVENIRAFSGEIERVISNLRAQSDRQLFGGAADTKANNLANALQRAKSVNDFDSVQAFAEYKEVGKSSIKDALGLSVKMFGRAEAQQEAENLITKYSI